MAIFFGDELKNSNKNYPIIDISENNAKGVIFVKDITNPGTLAAEDLFNSTNVPYHKITKGVMIVDKASGAVYVYKGGFTNGTVAGGNLTLNNDNPDADTDLSNPNNGGSGTDFFTIAANSDWKKIGDTPIFSDNVYANIGSSNTFGKYSNTDLVPLSGKTALDAILDALTQYQPPVSADLGFPIGSMGSLTFDIGPRTDAWQDSIGRFTLTNPNVISMGSDADGNSVATYGIKEIKVERDGGSSFSADRLVGRIFYDETDDGNGAPIGWSMEGHLTSNSNGETFTSSGIESLNSQSTSASLKTFYFKDKDFTIDATSYPGYDLSGRESGIYKYKVTVTGYENDAVTVSPPDTANKARVVVSAASLPTVTDRGITRNAAAPNHSDIESGNTTGDEVNYRCYGNYSSTPSFTVRNNTPTTTITEIQILRGIHEFNALTGVITAPTSFTVVKTIALSVANQLTHNETGTYTLDDTNQDVSGNTGTYDGTAAEQVALGESFQAAKVEYRVSVKDDRTSDAGGHTELSTTSTVQFVLPIKFVYQPVGPDNYGVGSGSTTGQTSFKSGTTAAPTKRVNVGVSDATVTNTIGQFTLGAGHAGNFFTIYLPNANGINSAATLLPNLETNPQTLPQLGAVSQNGSPAEEGVGYQFNGAEGGAQNVEYTVYVANSAGGFAEGDGLQVI